MMSYNEHNPLDFVVEEPIDPNQEKIEPIEERLDTSESSGCIWPFLLLIGIGFLVYYLWTGVGKTSKKDKDEPVKELTQSEWHALQMEMLMLRTEVAEVKAINKTPRPISMYRFEQNSGSVNTTITLRNNTPKTITMVKGRIFYCSMKGNIITYADFSENLRIEPGMAKSINCRGRNMGEGYYYYKKCPDNTPEDHKYKIKFKILNYKIN